MAALGGGVTDGVGVVVGIGTGIEAVGVFIVGVETVDGLF
jgi:hypothetical protein